MGASVKQGVEHNPLRGGPISKQVLEDAFSSPQHLRSGAVVVPELQCLSPCECMTSCASTVCAVDTQQSVV